MPVGPLEPQSPSKFTREEMAVKRLMRSIRRDRDIPQLKGAHLLGVSRKQLEDIESARNYGSYITLQTLVTFCRAYEVPLSTFEGGGVKLIIDKQSSQKVGVVVVLKGATRIATVYTHQGRTGLHQLDILHSNASVLPQSTRDSSALGFVALLDGLTIDGVRLHGHRKETVLLTKYREAYHRAQAKVVRCTDHRAVPGLIRARDGIATKVRSIGAFMDGTAPFCPITGKRLVRRDGRMYHPTGEEHDGGLGYLAGYSAFEFPAGLDRLTALGYTVWKLL